MKEYIKFPSGDALDHVVDEFKSKWGVPQCFGAVDGCHVPICAPSEQHTDYYNRKGWYSMIIQGLVDANYQFLDVCIGWPGREVSMMLEFLHIQTYANKLMFYHPKTRRFAAS